MASPLLRSQKTMRLGGGGGARKSQICPQGTQTQEEPVGLPFFVHFIQLRRSVVEGLWRSAHFAPLHRHLPREPVPVTLAGLTHRDRRNGLCRAYSAGLSITRVRATRDQLPHFTRRVGGSSSCATLPFSCPAHWRQGTLHASWRSTHPGASRVASSSTDSVWCRGASPASSCIGEASTCLATSARSRVARSRGFVPPLWRSRRAQPWIPS